MPSVPAQRAGLVVIGGGPAGLMAAEVARAAGLDVDLYDSQGSMGRKFLLAGKGGLNLTHSESFEPFVARYGVASTPVRRWLQAFDNEALRAWARGLGVDTVVGSSGRVFPADLKAAPLLRGWLRRLRATGVRLHVHHRWLGIGPEGALRFRINSPTDVGTDGGEVLVYPAATILALGGGSWPQLGSDGRWVDALAAQSMDIAPLLPANCGFDVPWSMPFSQRFEGAPVKTVMVATRGGDSTLHSTRGEFIVTAGGVEGGAIYALSAPLRETIARDGMAELRLDLSPARDAAQLESALRRPRQSRSLTEHLRRTIGLEGVKTGLLYECLPRNVMNDPAALAVAIKSLPLRLLRPRPLAEAISTAGGVRFNGLDDFLMLRGLPGIFCAGEMIDWEAPTGGYLLTACMASGRMAAHGALNWLRMS